ncbi:hypothetical protein EMMF5_005272 [Cystobasidiomycetes sp. EMM_F5]
MSLLPTSRAGSGAKYSSLPTNGEIGNASYDSDIANGESVEMTSSGSAGIGLINGGQRGGKRRNGSNLRAMLLRPRTFVVCIVGLAITVLVVHDDSRIAAHSALKNAGVPLPDSLDDVRTGLNKWYEGHGTSTWLPSSSSGSGSGSKETEPDDGIEWEDTAAPHSSTSWNSPDEPLIDKMTYHHSNGYLILPDPSKDKAIKPSEEERHPILELIENAERKWDALVKKQSKTLKEAVAEYKRRYKRNPPRGFDKWWDYAVANNIVLKDEYNQIWRDTEVFWALEPLDFFHRSKVMATEREETFTLHVDPSIPGPDKIVITGEEYKLKRATDLAALINRFSADLPGWVNLTFTKHDQPACALGHQHKERLFELAAAGEYFTSSDFIRPENPSLSNWANGCSPSSPLYQAELGELNEAHPSHPDNLDIQRSFIYDHSRAMDICQHPEAMHLHGFTTAIGTNLANLVPLFTFAKTNVHSDVLATPLEQYSDTYIGYDPEWEDKTINKLLWRGSTTGAEFRKDVEWKLSQRARLHFLGHETQGKKHVLWADKRESRMRVSDFEIADLNREYMDVSFSGHPVQCDDETCALMDRIIEFAPTMGLDDSYQYKFLMDVDGNGWSGRFHRLMSTKSIVLKSTIFPEWYSERIMPWVHYVPIKVDYSDLYDVMTFFIGTPDGRGSHDDLAAKLAAQGKEYARTMWRKEDMASYMFRLILEWARITHRGGEEDLDFNLE